MEPHGLLIVGQCRKDVFQIVVCEVIVDCGFLGVLRLYKINNHDENSEATAMPQIKRGAIKRIREGTPVGKLGGLLRGALQLNVESTLCAVATRIKGNNLEVVPEIIAGRLPHIPVIGLVGVKRRLCFIADPLRERDTRPPSCNHCIHRA